MGNTQVCKECETFSHRADSKSLSSSNRIPVTVTINGKEVPQPPPPTIEALPGNKFRIEYATGEVYVGDAVGEVRHGQGRMYWPQGGNYYEGAWENNNACGQGTFNVDGAIYVGLFKNNEIVKGKYVSANGKQEYEGEFKANRFQGQGKLRKIGQYVYVGQFRDNLKNGRGHIAFENGNEFEGQFLNGKFHGQGIFRSPTHTYQGEFRNGEYHGQGKYTWSSGNYYEGRYEDGEKSGFGVYQNIDGSRYEGNWLRGKRHGQGVQVSALGERIECKFENGARVA